MLTALFYDTVGGAMAGAAFVAIMAAFAIRLPGVARPVTTAAGYVTVWWACAGLVIVVAGLALGMRIDGRPLPTTVVREAT